MTNYKSQDAIGSIFSLKGRNYVVTGGAQGIGFSITKAIAQLGGNVVAMDIKDQPKPEFFDLAKEFNVIAEFIQADVTNQDSLKSGFERAVEMLGSVDGCVTCAGIALDKPFEEHTWDDVQKILNINVLGTFFTSQYAVEQMKKQDNEGSIVMIASITAHTVLPHHHMSAYSASKGAVKMLSESLAVELAPYNIRINTLSPGFIDTEMTRVARESNPDIAKIMFSAPPLRRIGTPDDLTGAAVYLLSDLATYTTGTDIAITGGLHIGRIDT